MQGHTLETTLRAYIPERYEASRPYNGGMRLAFSRPTQTTTFNRQPGIGVEIAWNDPRRPWMPFVILYLGRQGIQFGWLWTKREE